MNARLVQISNEAYHAGEGLSKSQLAVFDEAPALYDYRFGGDKRPPQPQTDPQRLGSAGHVLVLEPQLFKAQYFVYPRINKQGTKTIRSASHKFEGCWNDLVAEAAGRDMLSQDELEQVESIGEALTRHPAVRHFLNAKSRHQIETAIYWTDEETKLDLRCKPDDLLLDEDVIIDFKFGSTAEPTSFGANAFDFRYDLSVAQTSAGFEALYGRLPAEYIIIAVEAKPPHLTSCFTTMDGKNSFYEVGMKRWRPLLKRFAECKRTNVWPQYTTEIQPLVIPSYKLFNLEKSLKAAEVIEEP